jgi:hypothetical protein
MDACFIAGTLVETINGPKPIEQIHMGEYVLTRAGNRRVLSAGMTNPAAQVMRVAFSNGSILIGTPNHPIYGRQWFHTIRRRASNWHQSPAGREWHRERGKYVRKDRELQRYICQQCGSAFTEKGQKAPGFSRGDEWPISLEDNVVS